MSTHYIRHNSYPAKEILKLIANSKEKRTEYDGITVSVRSQRYQVFANGLTCVQCGLVGTIMAAERFEHDVNYHFNLYGIDEDGNEVLFTKDHIIPKSRGGKNYISNYQTMCSVCNSEKAHHPDIDREKYKLDKFNIFGSEDSLDYDVMCYIDEMPETMEECKQLCKYYDNQLKIVLGNISYFKVDKEINSNIAVLTNGVIDQCFKGIIGETNNSIYQTYRHHKQPHECCIKSSITVNSDWLILKTARSMRIILSLLSRTQYRHIIKPALKGNVNQKLSALMLIDFNKIEDFDKNNQNNADILKGIAFQLGQTMALLANFIPFQLYTKSQIGKCYPDLEPFVNRRAELNMDNLNYMRDQYITSIMSKFSSLETIKE